MSNFLKSQKKGHGPGEAGRGGILVGSLTFFFAAVQVPFGPKLVSCKRCDRNGTQEAGRDLELAFLPLLLLLGSLLHFARLAVRGGAVAVLVVEGVSPGARSGTRPGAGGNR